jgi:hypothetical protein
LATSTLNPIRVSVPRLLRAGLWLWVLALAAVLGLHLVHLSADFPNHSAWVDWAKYTDEGWYANAAIRHQQTGSWYMQGDFNPAVVLPVWPVLVGVLFHFTGVSLVALRALSFVVLLADLGMIYVLLGDTARRTLQAGPLGIRAVALAGVTLAASSTFFCAFTRIAILEPLLIFWFLLALWVAGKTAGAAGARRVVLAAALGLVLWLLLLTKTTGACLFPAIAWMLWPGQSPDQHGRGRGWRSYAATGAIAAATVLALGALYYGAVVRPHYLADFRYFFVANKWPHPDTVGRWLWNLWYTAHGVLWMGRLVPAVTAGVCLAGLGPLRRLWRVPLFGSAALSVLGVLAFIWWHNNSQARYYIVLAPGMILIATLGTAALLRQARWRGAGLGATAMLAAAAISGSWQIARTVAHPEYTYLHAAQSLARYIAGHPQGNPMVLSVSSDQLRLMTGIPAICDDFGTEPLADRIARYQPGWFASWNDVDGGTLEDIHTRYRLVREASFVALDDEDRDQLILYRMMPLPGPDVGVDVDNTP